MDQFQEKQQEKVTYYGKDVQTCISRRCWIHNAGCAGYFTKQILLDQAIELRNHRGSNWNWDTFSTNEKNVPNFCNFLNLLCSLYNRRGLIISWNAALFYCCLLSFMLPFTLHKGGKLKPWLWSTSTFLSSLHCVWFFCLACLSAKQLLVFFPMASQTEIGLFVTSLASFCLQGDYDVTLSHFHLLCFGEN